MTREQLNMMRQWLNGLTLEEWRAVRDEIDQHFGVKCMRLKLDDVDMREVTRSVALRMEMYMSAAEATQQTKLSL